MIDCGQYSTAGERAEQARYRSEEREDRLCLQFLAEAGIKYLEDKGCIPYFIDEMGLSEHDKIARVYRWLRNNTCIKKVQYKRVRIEDEDFPHSRTVVVGIELDDACLAYRLKNLH